MFEGWCGAGQPTERPCAAAAGGGGGQGHHLDQQEEGGIHPGHQV